MTTRYLRGVRVTVGDDEEALVVDNLLIRFRIRREATSTPAEGHVDIANLHPDNERRIHERGRRVRLEAGYGDVLNLIFEGDVRRVERQREALDRITRVHVGGNVMRQTSPKAVIVHTWEGVTPIRTIVADAVAVMGFDLGSLDLIPADAVETDFQYNDDARLLLTFRLKPLGIEWFEDDGVIRFSRIQKSASEVASAVTISEASGMIGTPTVTDDGIRVITLLDNRIKLDSRVTVESSLLDDTTAQWKVIVVEHSGDNRGRKCLPDDC